MRIWRSIWQKLSWSTRRSYSIVSKLLSTYGMWWWIRQWSFRIWKQFTVSKWACQNNYCIARLIRTILSSRSHLIEQSRCDLFWCDFFFAACTKTPTHPIESNHWLFWIRTSTYHLLHFNAHTIILKNIFIQWHSIFNPMKRWHQRHFVSYKILT